MSKVRYNEMLPHEIVAAREECPIAYVGLGGVEWHGEHLAVGNDTLKADMLAVRCAEQGGGLAFPALYWGEPRQSHLMETNAEDRDLIAQKMHLPLENFAPGYMGRRVHEEDRFYIELLVHILRQMESLGFRVMVLIAGHYPLLNHARAAIEWYSLGLPDAPATRAWVCSGYELVRDQIPDAGDHAQKWETSLLMALRPDCVDMDRLPADREQKLIGTGGGTDPRDSSPEYGEAGVKAVVAAIVKRAHELLRELSE